MTPNRQRFERSRYAWPSLPAGWRRPAIAGAAGLGLGLALAAGWCAGDPPRVPPESGVLRARVEALESALTARTEQSQELLREIERLRQELADAEQAALWTALAQAAAEAQSGAAARTPKRLGFDTEALVGAGLHWSEAEALRERWTEAERAKQDLTGRALAEGWAQSYRHHDALRGVDEAIREELDEADYDRLLYATGRPNRLVVQEVLEGTPAAGAGLRPGDRIVRVDGQRLFSSSELHAATALGDPDDPVRIEVERDGTRLSVFVPREPLGVLSALTRDLPTGP